MPKAGLTVAVGSGHWQGRGGINSRRREGKRVGKDGPAQPSPSAQDPGPGTRAMLVAQYSVGVQAGSQISQAKSGRQASRQALQIRHA